MDKDSPAADADPPLVLCWAISAVDPERAARALHDPAVVDSLGAAVASNVEADPTRSESTVSLDRLLVVRQDGRVVEPPALDDSRPAADAEFSRPLFEAAMTTIIRAAHRNGLDVRDCWALRNADGTPDWEVEINTVQKPLE